MKAKWVKMDGLMFTHVVGSDEMHVVTQDGSSFIRCDDTAWESFIQHLLHQKPIIFSEANVV